MKNTILLLTIFYLVSCGTKQQEKEQVAESNTEAMEHAEDEMPNSKKGMGNFHNPDHMKLEVDMAFQQQLKDLIIESTKLSSEFVTSDAQKVKVQAEVAMNTLDKVDRKLLDEMGNGLWLEGVQVIAHMLHRIRESDDIEAQRKSFAIYNNSLFFMAKAFGIADQQVYYQYCPMAFDNQGAYWISGTKEVLNPYFGDKMLHCGSNKDGINVELEKETVKI